MGFENLTPNNSGETQTPSAEQERINEELRAQVEQKDRELTNAGIRPREYRADVEETENWGKAIPKWEEIERRQQAELAFKDRLNGTGIPINPEKQVDAVLESVGKDRLAFFNPILSTINENIPTPLRPEIRESIRVNIFNEILKNKEITDILYSIAGGFAKSVKKGEVVNIDKMDNYVKTFNNYRVKYLKQKVKEFTQARLAKVQQPIIEQVGTGGINTDTLLALRTTLEEHYKRLPAGKKILEEIIATPSQKSEKSGETTPAKSEYKSISERLEEGQKSLQTLAVNDPFVVKFLLKIPIIGGIIGSFLGLSSKNPLKDFENHIENNKFLGKLKGLGIQKNKANEGKEPFINADFSKVNYSEINPELDRIKAIAGDNKTEDFWKQAFGDGYGKEKPKLKFNLGDYGNDKEITTEEFKKILKAGLADYDEQVKKAPAKEAEEERKRRETEEEARRKAEESEKQIEKAKAEAEATITLGALNILTGEDNEIQNLINIDNFKKIKIESIKNVKNKEEITNLLKTGIGEKDWNKLSDELKNKLIRAIEIIKKWGGLKSTSDTQVGVPESNNIGIIIKDPKFIEYTKGERTTAKKTLNSLQVASSQPTQTSTETPAPASTSAPTNNPQPAPTANASTNTPSAS